MNATVDSSELKLWVKVFLENNSCYKDSELIELLLFKLPWFTSTTIHGQNFNCFLRLVLAILPHDVSFIPKVINYVFSSQGLFQ
jgi:hypothetical protein